MRTRCLRLVMFLSATLMLVTPALAADESAAPAPAGRSDQVCIYMDGRTDTPETGPVPCDTSRRYMMGTTGFGSSRIPADTEFSTSGPRSHVTAPSGSDTGSVEHSVTLEGTLASPPGPNEEPDLSTHIQAP